MEANANQFFVPWKVTGTQELLLLDPPHSHADRDDSFEGIVITDDAGEGDEVCVVYGPDTKHLAGFIVRACNSHKQLLEACQAAIKATGGSANWRGETKEFLLQCEAAIAAASGES